MGPTAASEWPVGSPLLKGKLEAQSMATGTTQFIDVACPGDREVTVMADMTGGASGDLAVTIVPYEADGVTLLANAPLTPIRSTGPAFAGAAVQYTGTYDVGGIEKVRIIVKNNNAGTQTLTRLSYKMDPQ